jgi:hypothetical protein
MPHLRSFRLGWQSENLARFILYKFSFVSSPVQTADDIGVDFICTLFDQIPAGSNKKLIPTSSFAIQIKSNDAELDTSTISEALNNLAIPFFIGVVDRGQMSLEIYSGENIPLFFSWKGPDHPYALKLCERTSYDGANGWFDENNNLLMCPKITRLTASMTEVEIQEEARKLLELCNLIQFNIAARNTNEFVFKIMHQGEVIGTSFAGPYSAQFFEENFFKRFQEVFFNLLWLWKNGDKEDVKRKFLAFENAYMRVKEAYPNHKLHADAYYEQARNAILFNR